jgi:hypothetical protein
MRGAGQSLAKEHRTIPGMRHASNSERSGVIDERARWRLLAERLARHPENAPGAEKGAVLRTLRAMERFMGNACATGPSLVAKPVSELAIDPYAEACLALEGAGVRYVVIGGFGMNLYALERGVIVSTQGCDLLIHAQADVLLSALGALRGRGFLLEAGGEPLVDEDASIAEGIVRARATVRAAKAHGLVDLLLQARALDFEDCWARRTQHAVEGVALHVAPLDAIVASKRAVNRKQDQLALEMWREQFDEPSPPAG